MRHKWRLNHKPRTLASSFTPAAEGHGLCPWMNAPTFGRDVAPLGREEGDHGLCPWGSTSVMLFLDFYGKSGKRAIESIERVDLEGFIEHEQDRGLRISTVRTRLVCIIAFLHFLMEQDIVPGSVLKRGIKLKLPDVLPRAMNPADVESLSVVGLCRGIGFCKAVLSGAAGLLPAEEARDQRRGGPQCIIP